MQKSIIVHISKFKRHEQTYMFEKIRNARSWLFYNITFSNPPLQSNILQTKLEDYSTIKKPNQDASSFKSVTN